MDMTHFYVYAHKLPDTDIIFYVGKGKGDRATNFRHRNNFWKRIVEKHGKPKVEYLVQEVEEEFAFLVEQEAISLYRKRGYILANLTDGGEGPSGRKHSPETIEKLSLKKQGYIPYNKGIKTGPLSPEHREKIKNAMLGRTITASAREKLSAAHKGKKKTDAAKKAMSEAKKGKVSNRKGVTLSKETKKKISLAQRNKKCLQFT